MKSTFFGLPYYKTKIQPRSYDKEQIIKTIEDNYSQSSYRNEWDKNDLNKSNFHHSNSDESNSTFAKVDSPAAISSVVKVVSNTGIPPSVTDSTLIVKGPAIEP